jgi:hypothetical protein
MAMPFCSDPQPGELQLTELYCQWKQIMTYFFQCAEKWSSEFYILLTISYILRLHLTTPTIHDTMFSIKRNFSLCFAVSTMTSRRSIGWRTLETTVLLDTCTKKYYKKMITKKHRRASPIGYQIFGLVWHKTIKCHLLNFRILMC